jgi:Putative mono-oxygenase ydhR
MRLVASVSRSEIVLDRRPPLYYCGTLPEELRPMITAIVQYRLPSSIDLEACAEHFRRIAPRFLTVPGLIRKQFIYAEDRWAGGVYLWKTRADAEAFYSGPWLAGIRERYGMDPQIKYFHTACITDNSVEAVLLPDAG